MCDGVRATGRGWPRTGRPGSRGAPTAVTSASRREHELGLFADGARLRVALRGDRAHWSGALVRLKPDTTRWSGALVRLKPDTTRWAGALVRRIGPAKAGRYTGPA